jgi:2-polyprenyl-3-methyl-5-hydroxy-6-metoxy-1,4-benzoquinol methylase
MKKIENCPNCDSKKQTKFLSCIDNTYSKETFTIVKCSKCDLAFTNPIPEIKDLGKYYESKEYISHTNNNKGWFNTLYQIARLINIKSKIKTIGHKKGTLLEIGSGTGELTNACKKAGWTTTGIEPSMKARKNAKDNLNLELFENIEQAKLKDKSQDIIMMWHVLEHIPNLKETTQKINKLLKDDGRLIIAVPNHKSYDAAYYKESWAAYDVPRHLLHFNKKTMALSLKSAGFEIIKTKPMWLDSIYVSMLSEKIMSGNKNPTRAIMIGLISNLKALIKTKEYSSIIYIAKKTF